MRQTTYYQFLWHYIYSLVAFTSFFKGYMGKLCWSRSSVLSWYRKSRHGYGKLMCTSKLGGTSSNCVAWIRPCRGFTVSGGEITGNLPVLVEEVWDLFGAHACRQTQAALPTDIHTSLSTVPVSAVNQNIGAKLTNLKETLISITKTVQETHHPRL